MRLNQSRPARATPARNARSAIAQIAVVAVAAAAVLCCGGCSRDDELPTPIAAAPEAAEHPQSDNFDLVARFAIAEAHVNTTRIDFGSADAQRHLISGWGSPEAIGDNPVQWAMGPRSAFWIFSADSRPLALTFRAWPLLYPESPPQTIALSINGHPLAPLELEPRQRTYRIDIPADLVAAGRNRIDAEYAYSGDPNRDRERPDLRPLAVLWDWLETDLPPCPGPPRLDGDTAIALPPGSGLDYFFDLPPGAALSIAEIEARPAGGSASLTIEIVADRAADGAPVARRISVPVAPRTPEDAESAAALPLVTGVSQISLRAPPSSDGDHAETRLVAPRILATTKRATAAPQRQLPRAGGQRPNVVIYLIDALRSDHLGVYGYDKPTSPNIDAFAAEAVVFDNATAQTSWTRPAVASTLTGLSIPTHGIIRMETALSPQSTTIAEVLQQHAFATAAFTLNAQISRETGFDQGFGQYHLETDEPKFERLVHDYATNAARPFFAYVHTIEPHTPYLAEPDLMERFAPGIDATMGRVGEVEKLGNQAFRLIVQSHFTSAGVRADPGEPSHRDDLIALYDAEVASADARFARFLHQLRDLNLYDDALIVLLADHGEEFYDHGRLAHGMTLYGEQTRIPLMVRFPGGAGGGRRIAARVSQIDIMPTILDQLGIAAPPEVEGRSLLPLIGGATWREAPAFSYLDWFGGRARSVVAENAKLIHNLEMGPLLRPVYELYDLGADPGEQHNIAAARPVLLGYLKSLMRETRQRRVQPHEPAKAKIDPAFAERMRALGYMP